MTQQGRVRRALLFMPGDDLHKIEKGAASGVDSIIMDLEDGVALNRKAAARETIVKALNTVNFGRSERLIRINPVGSGLDGDDLATTLPGHPDGYVIPKVERGEDVQRVSNQIASGERMNDWKSGAIRLLAIVETAKGIVNLKEIAGSDPRLDALIFGAEDLAGSLGALRTKEGWEVFYGRSAVITYAAAFDLQAIDSIQATLDDTASLIGDSLRALEMGYSGKLAIHPRQLQPITEVFTPTDDSIAQARRLVEAHKAHQQSGAGVFALEGKMIDMPMIRAAERILARAHAAGKT